MNLILLHRDEIAPSGRATVRDARARHIIEVLRAATGEQVRVGIVDGPRGMAYVAARAEDQVTLDCTFDSPTPPRPPVDLLLALPRPKVMRRLWAQLAAIGVGRVILTNAERVERNYFDTHLLRPDVFTPLLLEGLQQARDTRLPLVSVHRRFRVLVEDDLDALSSDATRIVADPAAQTRVGDALQPTHGGRVLLAVGPEGGWNHFELDLLAAHRFVGVSMGPRTLRVDTACIALLSLVNDAR